MEENIIQEALELVRHAMSLVDLKLYDEAIRILRQATRLYEQTNLEEEKNALRKKIAEIYTLKETALEEDDVKSDTEQILAGEITPKNQVEVEVNTPEEEKEIIREKSDISPEALMQAAEELIAQNQFEEALDKYEEALKLLNMSNRSSDVDNVYKLIEECYVLKAKFLKQSKEEKIVEEDYIDSKEMVQSRDLVEEKIIISETDKPKIETDKLKAVEEKYKRDFEDEELQRKITSMVDTAEKMAREYESIKLKSLKDGYFEDPCIYPDVIAIYNDAYNLLVERGWVDQAKIYANQISIYKDKLEKDIKLREIEAMKAQRDKEFESLMKSDKGTRTIETGTEKLKFMEEKLKKDIEDENFQNFIVKTVADAEKLVRDYELEIKKGNFQETCPYQQVIDTYTKIRQNLIDRGWMDQLDIYTNQIRIYNSKLEQDKKLREIEAQKKEKDKAYLDSLKISQQDKGDDEKLKALDTKILSKYKEEIEEVKFQNIITSLVEEADKMDRDYDSKKKRAIKEKNLLDLESPYLKIIEIYEKIRDMLLQKGWQKQAAIYSSQIQVYQEKFERDKILREIEAHKLGKELKF
ncbi:MAG: hypothetical protein EU532_00465 [Promethearchaeota archaeon]|nr:MAG: hypothetical protein EU532_00465 [Candidatus Lokiarchaeota archaeon]